MKVQYVIFFVGALAAGLVMAVWPLAFRGALDVVRNFWLSGRAVEIDPPVNTPRQGGIIIAVVSVVGIIALIFFAPNF